MKKLIAIFLMKNLKLIKKINDKNVMNISNIQKEHNNAMNILETDLRAAHKEEILLLSN